MAEGRDRSSETGQYESEYSDVAFIKAIEALGGESASKPITDEVGCSYEAAYRRLRVLEERGEVASRTPPEGGDTLIWRLQDGEIAPGVVAHENRWMLYDDRDDPRRRSHNTYTESHERTNEWVVVDADRVDQVFATPSQLPAGDGDGVRVDLDGYAHPSRHNAVDRDENLQMSFWLNSDFARELRDQIDESLETSE